jgi:predicted TIM-barrel fold metal-dependent hydrolase
MTVDAWLQHPTVRFAQHEMFDSLRRWTSWPMLKGELDLAFTDAALDEAGVDIGLLSAWHGPRDGAMISNDEVAAWVHQRPDRYRGIASVDLTKPVAAIRELRRVVRDHGFVGLRVLPWLWEVPPTHALFYPLLATCVELNIPFCTQVGHAGPLRPSEVGRPIPYIDQVAIDFPDLNIVCGHIGYPWTTEMIAVADKHPNVYIDTSAYTVRRYPVELVEYMRGRGRTRVLFGTNYPMITPSRALAGLADLDLDDETTADFLDGNARRVFAL